MFSLSFTHSCQGTLGGANFSGICFLLLFSISFPHLQFLDLLL